MNLLFQNIKIFPSKGISKILRRYLKRDSHLCYKESQQLYNQTSNNHMNSPNYTHSTSIVHKNYRIQGSLAILRSPKESVYYLSWNPMLEQWHFKSILYKGTTFFIFLQENIFESHTLKQSLKCRYCYLTIPVSTKTAVSFIFYYPLWYQNGIVLCSKSYLNWGWSINIPLLSLFFTRFVSL